MGMSHEKYWRQGPGLWGGSWGSIGPILMDGCRGWHKFSNSWCTEHGHTLGTPTP